MLLKYFKSSHIGVFFLVTIIVMSLWWDMIDNQSINTSVLQFKMPAYKLINGFLTNRMISGILALLLVFFQASYVVYINRKYNFITQRTYLTGIFFIFISSSFSNLHYLHPVIFANIFLLLTVVELFSTYRKAKVYASAFNIGFWVALATLFYVNAIIFLLFAFLGLSIIRSFNWREWISVVLGFVCPWILTFVVLFYTDSWLNFLSDLSLIIGYYADKISWNYPYFYYVFVSVLSLITFLSLFSLSQNYSNNKVSTRMYFSLFVWLLILLVASFVLIPFVSSEIIVLLAVPLSYLFSNYYLSKGNKWVQEISFWVFILSICGYSIEKLI